MATSVKQKMKVDDFHQHPRLHFPKKHSVLFRPTEDVEKSIVTGLYLKKHTHVGLGSPDEIELIIEAVD